MTKFEELDKARRLLDLGQEATLKDIKRAYKEKAFQYHPDRKGEKQQKDEMMKELNWAYKLLTEYCADYSYSFSEEAIARTYPYDEYLKRYHYGWFDGI